eukprot:GHVU01024027.1.p1 GENE.GHVU01024027.1~~GHVU01024027.1.p1  ORF type:complete len:167 (+),score=10.31 GHVU01024027.1:1-501(+)
MRPLPTEPVESLNSCLPVTPRPIQLLRVGGRCCSDSSMLGGEQQRVELGEEQQVACQDHIADESGALYGDSRAASLGGDSHCDESVTDNSTFDLKEIVGYVVEDDDEWWKVTWVGFSDDDATWEPTTHLQNISDESVARMQTLRLGRRLWFDSHASLDPRLPRQRS